MTKTHATSSATIDLPHLIPKLIEALNEKNIRYCHWKSNFSLTSALAGDLDLDLLVDRSDLTNALNVLTSLGFKRAFVRNTPEIPGVSHYYGFDPDTAILIHVHLFTNVLTGESFVKSHMFPFENMLLADGYQFEGIRVTSKSAELVIFIVRHMIKYGSLLDIIYLIGKSEEIKAELLWLLDGADIDKATEYLAEYCPVVDSDLFKQCIQSLSLNTSMLSRILLARKMRRRLFIYKRNSFFAHHRSYGMFLSGYIFQRMRGLRRNKMIESGGSVIAILGADATGKSTMVKETKRWLGSVFATRKVHAGRPPSTLMTAPLNLILQLIRRLKPGISGQYNAPATNETNAPEKPPKGISALLLGVRSVVLAWDRRALLLKVHRWAANGQIVICDRYPSEIVGAMDSPRLQRAPGMPGIIGKIYRRLESMEKRLYQQIPPPDVALKLHVSVATAKQRNNDRNKPGKETDEYLEYRHSLNRKWQKPGTQYMYDVDTEQTLEATILNVKKNIWESL